MGEFIGIDTQYQSKGLASTFLDWVCRQADEMGLEIYIDATAVGLPIYKSRYGFDEVKSLHMPVRPATYGTYEVVAMVRSPKRPTVRSLL